MMELILLILIYLLSTLKDTGVIHVYDMCINVCNCFSVITILAKGIFGNRQESREELDR